MALAAGFCPTLPAVDPRLLNLVMPDAVVLAGVNVTQAETTPFGQYVLGQLATNDAQMQQLVNLTGFDPRKDVNELLVASNGAAKAGLALATGTFDASTITAFATAHGAATETYNGVTILEDPKQTHGIAFLSGAVVAAGDLADVKAAIDRVNAASVLPAALVTQANQLSGANDAWFICTVPPASLHPAGTATGTAAGLENAAKSIQSVFGGVTFGTVVTAGVTAQADNAQDASTLASLLQLLVNMAQMQSTTNTSAATLASGLTIKTSGATLVLTLSLPESQFQQLLAPGSSGSKHRAVRKM
ncbi:MAG: hypothetical protein ABSH56_24115 [Bryobacteraceae bacterium]|jgi:hypothetical protein